METKDTYSREDLLYAWLNYEQSRASHPDITDYYYRQLWALVCAYEGWGPMINFSKVPREKQQLWTVFRWAIEAYTDIRQPWGVFLAGRPDPSRAEVEAQHRPPIAEACEALREAYRALLLDLLERIWDVGPGWSVSLDKLRENGFDPDAPPPNFDLYW